MPVKSTEVYTRPIWKHVSTPCQPQTHVNQMCTRVQLVHEQAFRDVIRHKSAQQVTYDCCTGWMRESPHADGCMKRKILFLFSSFLSQEGIKDKNCFLKICKMKGSYKKGTRTEEELN